MRHLELIRFLLVTSFTTQSDSVVPDAAAVASRTGVSRSDKLHAAIPRTAPVPFWDQEKKDSSIPKPLLVGRRRALSAFAAGGSWAFMANNGVAKPPKANALDIESFMKDEIDSDTKNCNPKSDPKCKPELSADQALCQYGQSGNARGEACKRVKAAGGDLPKANQGKSLGGAYAM